MSHLLFLKIVLPPLSLSVTSGVARNWFFALKMAAQITRMQASHRTSDFCHERLEEMNPKESLKIQIIQIRSTQKQC